MKFKQINEEKILILDDKGKEVGHIFSPSSSNNNAENCIQICGFSEAFDYWACGIYKHKKDIQLLFDDVELQGEQDCNIDECWRCFHKPCQCENKINFENTGRNNPFNVKREEDLTDRIKYSHSNV